MKLRQKLAAVLAATMIVTAVPVVTMAASVGAANTVSAIEGSKIGYDAVEITTGASFDAGVRKEVTATSGAELNITLDDQDMGKSTVFYLTAQDMKFNKDAFIAKAKGSTAQFDASGNLIGGTIAPEFTVTQNGISAKITYLNEDQARVTLNTTAATGKNISLPMLVEAKKGTPTVVVDGNDSFVKSGKVVLTNEITSDKNLTVKFDQELNVIPVEGYGELGTITLTEAVKGALNSAKAADRTITIKLPGSSDLEFDAKQTVTFKGGRGLAGQTLTGTVTVDEKDSKLIKIVFDQTGISDSTGYIEIKGLDVKPEDPRVDAKLGKVEVTVKGDAIAETTGTAAEVKNYGVSLKAEEVVALTAGKEAKKVKLTLQEAAVNSLNKRHDIYFELNEGDIVKDTVKVVKDDKNTTISVREDLDKEGKVRGFYVDLDAIKENESNRIQVEFEVKAKLDVAGEVKVTAESRSFEAALEAKIADVKAPVTIKVEPVTVKVGLNGQQGGKITLTESDKEMISKGQLVLTFDQKGIEFGKDNLKIETNGTLDVKVDKVKGNTVTLDVKRTSKEAATLTISGFELNVDRTVPEGTVEILVGGSALSDANTTAKPVEETIEVAEFIKVGTINTEDGSNGTAKAVEAGFKIGNTKYTVNGEEKTMDAAPYVSSKGRTMMPLRYVAEAFGIQGNDVMFSNANGGTITIFSGNRVLQLKNNSDVATVNGVQIKMDEKVTIKAGRTYVPVGEVGRLLGVQVAWDNTTKTATFTNK